MSCSSLDKKHLVLCIGNRDGGDDSVGPYIADQLKRTNSDITVIDCGVVPENYTSVVRRSKPDVVVVVDAVEMNLNPGEIRIIAEKRIGVMHISTHGIPLSVLINYLKQFVTSVVFIGIQPKDFSAPMSPRVQKSADRVVEIIRDKRYHQIKALQ